MIQGVTAVQPCLFSKLKESVLAFVESLRVKDACYGVYRMSPSLRPYLFSSCYAVFIRELFDDLATLTPHQRMEWIEFINAHQDPKDGLFREPGMHESDMTTHPWEYLLLQGTTFALQALDALGARPRYPITYHARFYNLDTLRRWLHQRSMANIWLESNMIMFVGVLLSYDLSAGKMEAAQVLHSILDWLDERQEPTTGYWGTDHGASLLEGAAGTFHFLMFYYFLHRDIHHIDRIVDCTLSLQQRDGLFSPTLGGGACEDLDCLDILANLYFRYNYRRGDIRDSIGRALKGLLRLQNPDGGFPYTRKVEFKLHDWFTTAAFLLRRDWDARTRQVLFKWAVSSQLKRNSTKSTEWKEITIPTGQSDLWSTWFRCYTIALSTQVLDDSGTIRSIWGFRRIPGLGWCEGYRQVHRQS